MLRFMDGMHFFELRHRWHSHNACCRKKMATHIPYQFEPCRHEMNINEDTIADPPSQDGEY